MDGTEVVRTNIKLRDVRSKNITLRNVAECRLRVPGIEPVSNLEGIAGRIPQISTKTPI